MTKRLSYVIHAQTTVHAHYHTDIPQNIGIKYVDLKMSVEEVASGQECQATAAF